jgi:hypothetical protein
MNADQKRARAKNPPRRHRDTEKKNLLPQMIEIRKLHRGGVLHESS